MFSPLTFPSPLVWFRQVDRINSRNFVNLDFKGSKKFPAEIDDEI